MPTIINIFMHYVCAKHPNQELVVVQPSNQACQVTPCPVCCSTNEEQENRIREIRFDRDNLEEVNQRLVADIKEKQKKIANLSKPKTRKNKQGEYLKGGKK